jgi:hypothetical protein
MLEPSIAVNSFCWSIIITILWKLVLYLIMFKYLFLLDVYWLLQLSYARLMTKWHSPLVRVYLILKMLPIASSSNVYFLLFFVYVCGIILYFTTCFTNRENACWIFPNGPYHTNIHWWSNVCAIDSVCVHIWMRVNLIHKYLWSFCACA